MLRGVATATSQLIAQGLRLKALAANLANVDSPGYRQDQLTEQSFDDIFLARLDQVSQQVGTLSLGTEMSAPIVDLSQGPLESTGRGLDLAISGPGLFAVQSPGGVEYTRRGAFHQDASGRLVSLEGWSVLGQRGPIAANGPLSVTSTGDVVAGGRIIDRLQIANLPAGAALSRRDGTYVVPEATDTPVGTVATPQVMAGYLEGSNVDLTSTMTDLLAATRSYQAAQQALTSQDTALSHLIDETNTK
jgi:flagellar basal-body rod protein FlgG